MVKVLKYVKMPWNNGCRISQTTKNYELWNIFNYDETSIFFKALPKKTLLGPNEQPEGLKQSKECFSLLVCANAIGEKEKLLVIGKAKRPHSFLKYNSNLEQHITYRSNKRGWMTTAIFTEFLNSLNNKMRCWYCHILMFLNNCSSHPHLNLSNIELCFLSEEYHIKATINEPRCNSSIKKEIQ